MTCAIQTRRRDSCRVFVIVLCPDSNLQFMPVTFGHCKCSCMYMISMWQKLLFSEVTDAFPCFSTGGLPAVLASVLQNGKCQINTPWRRPHYFCLCFGGCRISVVSLVSLDSLEISPCFSRMHSHRLSKKDSGLWLSRAFSSYCGWSVNYKDTNSWTCSRHFNTDGICYVHQEQNN